jgi:hypothetical protein
MPSTSSNPTTEFLRYGWLRFLQEQQPHLSHAERVAQADALIVGMRNEERAECLISVAATWGLPSRDA